MIMHAEKKINLFLWQLFMWVCVCVSSSPHLVSFSKQKKQKNN